MSVALPPPGTRLLLASPANPVIAEAVAMARDAGADVAVVHDSEAALAELRAHGADLMLLSVELDCAATMAALRRERFSLPVIACGIHAPAEAAVAAIHAGARDYVPLPPDRELIAAAILSVVEGARRLVGRHPGLMRPLDFGLAMARGPAPILICGEPGSGRDLMGRTIHAASGRKGRLVVVECRGVAPDILESELFGHAEGSAGPGVPARIGRLAEAAGGTLLLREVTALSQRGQAQLLAELKGGLAARGGQAQPARVIATASAELPRLVAEGGFRADLAQLFGRVRLDLPPLRARQSDIPLLAAAFAEASAAANGLNPRPFTPEALARLKAWPWPGNVRELEDMVYRATLLAEGPAIGVEALVLDDGRQLGAPAEETGGELKGLVGRSVESVERELILSTLAHCRGNRTTASSILGISVRTMRNKLRSFAEAGLPIAPAS